jgi:hypothetical protein
LTPFQNQVLDAAEKKEQEEKEKQREEARNGNGPQRNSRGGPSGGSPGSKMEQEETVRYVNRQENPDHEVHD